MDILKQFEGKINGTLETFDRIIINGYLKQLHSFRLFLYYLIQKEVLLKDFNSFAAQQTDKGELIGYLHTVPKHYYFYYNDGEVGWMFLKIQKQC